MIDISIIRNYTNDKMIFWTNHSVFRMNERKISQEDVINCILLGRIIERHENKIPYPSCLILGYGKDETAIHVVCALSESGVYILTTYRPSTTKWYEDFIRRR